MPESSGFLSCSQIIVIKKSLARKIFKRM